MEVEVEVGWKWKIDGGGRMLKTIVDGPNERP